MRFRAYIGVIALALALGLGFSQPAKADIVTDLLRGYVQTRDGNPRFAANQAMIRNNVDNMINTYYNEISSGVASGQLTPSEAARLQVELDRIVAMRDTYMLDGGYTDAEVQSMLSRFTSMNTLVSTALTNVETTVGSAFRYRDRFEWRDYNALVSLQRRVKARIDDARARGDISRADARDLLDEYNQIDRQIDRRAARGNVNTTQAFRRLTALDRKLSNTIAARRGTPWWF